MRTNYLVATIAICSICFAAILGDDDPIPYDPPDPVCVLVQDLYDLEIADNNLQLQIDQLSQQQKLIRQQKAIVIQDLSFATGCTIAIEDDMGAADSGVEQAPVKRRGR